MMMIVILIDGYDSDVDCDDDDDALNRFLSLVDWHFLNKRSKDYYDDDEDLDDDDDDYCDYIMMIVMAMSAQ